MNCSASAILRAVVCGDGGSDGVVDWEVVVCDRDSGGDEEEDDWAEDCDEGDDVEDSRGIVPVGEAMVARTRWWRGERAERGREGSSRRRER